MDQVAPAIARVSLAPAPSGALLQYAAPGIDSPKRRWLDLPALVLSLPAIVAPFVSFTWSTSPLDVFVSMFLNWQNISLPSGFDTLVLVAAPFFIGPLFCACKLRLLIHPAHRPAERQFLWIAAMVSVACSLAFLGQGFLHSLPRRREEIISYVLPLVILTIGGLAIAVSRRRLSADRRACLAISTAYVAAVSIPLYAFHESPDWGWHLTLAAAIVFVVDSALMLIPARALRLTPGNRRRGDAGD